MNPALDPADASQARLHLFGDFHLARAALPIHLPTRKVELLLAYLALSPNAHSREQLAALLWGDFPDEQARASLRKALTLLRVALGADVVLADRLSVRLNPGYPLWVDVDAFERASGESLDEWAASLDLYRGDLLQGFYADWLMPRREHYRTSYLERALSLAGAMRARSEYERAIAFARRALDADPANERAHQHLIFCFLALGRRSEALQQVETCKRLLWEELSVEPSAETIALYRWIKQEPAGRRAAEALLTNLPIPLSSFIGREQETAEVKGLLVGEAETSALTRPTASQEPVARLVTLTGPGGSGKTRLAVQAATDLLDVFPDGVWWVELAALNDGAHVPQAVAKALGARESPDEPTVALLITLLRGRRLLLVLDNCEHLVTACATLADALLSQCPRLSIMATSRQALGLIGERAYPVPTLPVPRFARWALVESVLNFEGVRLFVERARAVNPRFTLTQDNAAAVTQICARLDGIPLAIELAAMWLKTLTVAELAARLDDRFDLLTLGSRVAPPRHQTLRGVLDWSHDLLSESERTLFHRLSVFNGGWTLAAAQHVAGDNTAGGAPALDTLALLHQLVDKSLVVAQPSLGDTRYGMLETICDYARTQLRAMGEVDAIRARHLVWFVRLAEEAEVELRGAEQGRWLETLDRELDNLRAALEWATAADVQGGLWLAGLLAWYWNLRGHWHEGPAWVERLLALPGATAPTPARARALVAAANLAYWGSNDYAAARVRLEEAVAIYRATAQVDRWALANALALLGMALLDLDEPAAAQSALEESLALGESLGEAGKWVCAWAWMGLGDLSAEQMPKRARLEHSVALFRELGDRAQLPVALVRLAWSYLADKEYAAAEGYARESYALTEEVGDVMGAAWMLQLGGDLALAQTDHATARERYAAALERFRTLGSRNGIVMALYGLGEVDRSQGRPEAARRLWQEALALYEEMGQKRSQDWLSSQLVALGTESGDESFA